MNNLKMVLDENDILTKKLDTIMNEFEVANRNIGTLKQSLDVAVFEGTTTDTTLTELTSASLHRDSLRRVIADIRENMIPAADQRIEIEEEKAIEDIQAARQVLYDKCAGDIQKKANDILKIVQTFDAECQKLEEEAGITISQNLPIFHISENDRIQFSD